MHTLLGPIERFIHVEAASGITLMLAALVALAWANSPWAAAYHATWATQIGLQIGDLVLVRPLGWVVNDILMAVFFFVIGLEIRREIAFGALDTWPKAAMPLAGALGGMLVPAGLFVALADGDARVGWGVPMATDIAFALGVLTLLGRRVPAVLRISLLAVAVIDDLGAIIVIAIFYSSGSVWLNLALGVAGLGAIWILQIAGVRARGIYFVPALVVWIGVYTGGLHPTIAGVLVGVMTPVRAWMDPRSLADVVAPRLAAAREQPAVSTDVARVLEHASRESRSPAADLIDRLHPWVAFAIMPAFALANAGVPLGGGGSGGFAVGIAVVVGLVIGKPLGIGFAITLVTKLGIARLPSGIGLRQIVVLGLVAGIGFTMSLFIASLAFSDAALLDATKLGVLVASAIAAVLTLVVGRVLLPLPVGEPEPPDRQ